MANKTAVDASMLKSLQLKSLSDRVERLAQTLNSILIFACHNKILDDDLIQENYPFARPLHELVFDVNKWATTIEQKRLDDTQGDSNEN